MKCVIRSWFYDLQSTLIRTKEGNFSEPKCVKNVFFGARRNDNNVTQPAFKYVFKMIKNRKMLNTKNAIATISLTLIMINCTELIMAHFPAREEENIKLYF